jgi:amylosucrase
MLRDRMQNVLVMRPAVRRAFERAVRQDVEPALAGRDAGERDALLRRLERFFTELYEPFVALYGGHSRFEPELRALVRAITAADAARPAELRALDHEREITPDWHQREHALGYVAYVDRFAGTLPALRGRLDHLAELGVSYLHLMPLLRARPEPNDGGYAVADYGAVEPALGTLGDLRALADELRTAGIALCIDVVLNHTAREHPWAQAALAGEPAALAFYRTYPDRTQPDAFERTLPEVFPATAPGSFTWVPEMAGTGRWVWTTFNPWQWDLDYANPAVLRAMAEAMLDLANHGVDVLRLDAVPFLWKRMGTSGQNEPEVHDVVQCLRAAFRIAAPAVAFKAEAIVSPHELVAYLGAGRHEGKECDLAYHNSLMVLLWSSLASGRVGLMTHALRRMPAAPVGTAWVTYVRCHDDIGWAITDEDAGAVGEDARLHRRFLVDFYAGAFPGSFARGASFQEDAASGDARTSGSAASLAGLQDALESGDEAAVDLAVLRLLLLHGIAFSFGGLPLVYMGDELGLRNDPAWAEDTAHAADNRWMHRPPMDWRAAARRHEPGTVEARLWTGMLRLVHARRSTRALHAAAHGEVFATGNDHVLGFWRRRAGHGVLVLANFTAAPQRVHATVPERHGFARSGGELVAEDRPLTVAGDELALDPYALAWLREARAPA